MDEEWDERMESKEGVRNLSGDYTASISRLFYHSSATLSLEISTYRI